MISYAKSIPVSADYDLVVCGGGMSGVSAAIAAARNGMSVALIERNGFLGGTATASLVTHLLGGAYYDKKDKRVVYNIGGIFAELCRALIDEGKAIDPENIDHVGKYQPHGWVKGLACGLVFDGEYMKSKLEQICRKENVVLYYLTDTVDVQVDENKITHVIVHNKDGLFALHADYFVDATGDADVAAMAGCEVRVGRDEDGLMAPASLEMVLENVDTNLLRSYIEENDEPRFRTLISNLREKGIWDFPYEIFICVQLTKPDVYMINTIRQTGINGLDASSLTNGIIDGRAENLRLLQILQNHFPGFANARLRAMSPTIGIRETRRIVGVETLTVEALITGKEYPDVIAWSSYGWDMPDPKKPSLQPMKDVKRHSRLTPIPYRCMIPKGMDNLICPGRAISADRDALGPVRVMACCMAMGEAAGTAAALAMQHGSCMNDVNDAELKQKLIDQKNIL